MRTALLLCSMIALNLLATAQKIDYDPPRGLPQPVSREDYKTILDSSLAVVDSTLAVAGKYKIGQVEKGTIYLIDENEPAGEVNLDNLVLKCLAEPDKTAWPAVIRQHFGQLFKSLDAQRHLEPGNYETIKRYLSIRIYPKETVDQRGGTDSLVYRTDLEDTYTLLMLDLPGAFTPVRKSMFDRWKKDAAEVFAVAQANVDSATVQKATKTFELKGTQVEITMLSEDNYAASYALDLGHNAPELVGEWGCALAMPNKGLVSLCRITRDKPIDWLKFIQLTQPFIVKSYEEAQQPISFQYFWYYKGKFTKIETNTGADGHLNVLAPAGLAGLMSQKP